MKENPNKLGQLVDLDASSSSRELIKVVRSLLRFITIESRDFIDADKKEEYIKNYLFALSKATSGMSNYVNMEKVKEQILLDIKDFCE